LSVSALPFSCKPAAASVSRWRYHARAAGSSVSLQRLVRQGLHRSLLRCLRLLCKADAFAVASLAWQAVAAIDDEFTSAARAANFDVAGVVWWRQAIGI